jgi:hypothetical protein
MMAETEAASLKEEADALRAALQDRDRRLRTSKVALSCEDIALNHCLRHV